MTPAPSIDFAELHVRYTFRKRPRPVLGDLRPVYRMSLLLLALKMCCRGARSTLLRLQVVDWGALSPDNGTQLLEFVSGERPANALIVRFDPSFNRALALAAGERLVDLLTGDRVSLATKGQAMVAEIEAEPSILERERLFLGRIGFRATQERIESLVRGGVRPS